MLQLKSLPTCSFIRPNNSKPHSLRAHRPATNKDACTHRRSISAHSYHAQQPVEAAHSNPGVYKKLKVSPGHLTWAASLVAIPAALALICSPPASATEIQGAFTMKCAGCHANGGNVLAAGASLFPEDLQRNGVADPESMFNLIYRGKGRMPGYGEGCAPKGQCTFGPRSSDEEIRGLVAYVTERAAAGWK